MTGILNQSSISTIDGKNSYGKTIEAIGFDYFTGGVIDGNWKSLGYQTAAVVTIAAWSFIFSYAILFVINKIPGLHLRITAEEELKGQDHSEIGEVAYEFQSMIFGKKSGSGSRLFSFSKHELPLRLRNDKIEVDKKADMEIPVENEIKADVAEVKSVIILPNSVANHTCFFI